MAPAGNQPFGISRKRSVDAPNWHQLLWFVCEFELHMLIFSPYSTYNFRHSSCQCCWKWGKSTEMCWDKVWALLSTSSWAHGWSAVSVYPSFVYSGRNMENDESGVHQMQYLIHFYTYISKVMGQFSYFSVLAYPGALGAAICASVLAERVIYSYAHGLSTIVSDELRGTSNTNSSQNISAIHFPGIRNIDQSWRFLHFQNSAELTHRNHISIHGMQHGAVAWTAREWNGRFLLADSAVETQTWPSRHLRTEPTHG